MCVCGCVFAKLGHGACQGGRTGPCLEWGMGEREGGIEGENRREGGGDGKEGERHFLHSIETKQKLADRSCNKTPRLPHTIAPP